MLVAGTRGFCFDMLNVRHCTDRYLNLEFGIVWVRDVNLRFFSF